VGCEDGWPTPYTEPHVFYQGVADGRGCAACTCGAPGGGGCAAEIWIYGDDACATVASYAVTVGSDTAACVDTLPGAALGSKAASAPTYTAGACQPAGGTPVGSVDLLGPTTFCCIPSGTEAP
jgi:hypothetical protein